MMNTEANPALAPLRRLVGTWTTEATHPAMPGVVVHGIQHGNGGGNAGLLAAIHRAICGWRREYCRSIAAAN